MSRHVALIGLAVGLSMTPAAAQRTTTAQMVVKHGSMIDFGAAYAIDAACRNEGYATAFTQVPPRGGVIRSQHTTKIYEFPTVGIANTCLHRLLPVTKAFYQARRDFRGPDSFKLYIELGDGSKTYIDMQVYVE